MDGVQLGFTDHDSPIYFNGIQHKAEAGLTASVLSQSTGLAVDNSEALGALSDSAISEADIVAGRYDGAEIEAWLVCWSDPAQRELIFRGSIGEITRRDGAFSAELRGLSEQLNIETGRVYHHNCPQILGDVKCGVDLSNPSYHAEVAVQTSAASRRFWLEGLGAYAEHWFEKGRLQGVTGAAKDLVGVIKSDAQEGNLRLIELWEPLPAEIVPGDVLRLDAGCDKRMATCRAKFNNLLNFRGFPDIPEDDWLTAIPARSWNLSGGSRR